MKRTPKKEQPPIVKALTPGQQLQADLLKEAEAAKVAEAAAKERELKQQQEALLKDKEAVAREYELIKQQQEALLKEKEAIARERELMQQQQEALRQAEEERLKQQEDLRQASELDQSTVLVPPADNPGDQVDASVDVAGDSWFPSFSWFGGGSSAT